MHSCKNCSSEFNGKYCSNCGQKFIDKRLTLKESVYWVLNSLFNLERGFFYTSKQLVTKPGKVVKDFLRGITIPYVHPFRFLFIWATISAILSIYTTAMEDSSQLFQYEGNHVEEQSKFMKAYVETLKQYMNIFIMFLIPLMSFASYLVLKRKKLNYAEHLVINAYGNATSIIITLPVTLCYFFLENTKPLVTISAVLNLLIMGRVYAKSFDDSLIAGILKYIVTFIIGMIFFAVVLVVVMIVVLFSMKGLGMPNPFEAT